MYNKRIIVIVSLQILCCLWAFNSYSQKLTIGDQFPDLNFNNVFNYNKNNLNISDLGKKPIILDFWSTMCISCLKSFPKLDSIQRIFGDSIQIILVNNQPFGVDSTKRLFEKRKKLYKPDLPFITQDTILKRLFAPVGLPMLVWIDADKKIRHITGSIGLNSNNVRDFLNGKKIDADPYFGAMEYYPSPFIPQLDQLVVYHSFLSISNQAGRFGGQRKNPSDIAVTRMPIPELFVFAYNEFDKYTFDKPKRLALEVSDTSKYIMPADYNLKGSWIKKNLFDYSLSVPEDKKENRFGYMQQDLERYFNLSATIEKRYVKCLVLVKTGDIDKIKTKGGQAISTPLFVGDVRTNDNNKDRLFYNRPYKMFSARIGALIEHVFNIPFIDEIQYNGNIDIKLSGKVMSDLTIIGLKKELNKYDLDLEEKNILLDILVLKEDSK